MLEPEPPVDGTETPGDADETRIVVAVVRTGGLAGLRRRWRAEPDPEQTPHWRELVERCPWDEPIDEGTGADRFVWSIHARLLDEQREQVIPDSRLDGAWRDLVDAVRAADEPNED